LNKVCVLNSEGIEAFRVWLITNQRKPAANPNALLNDASHRVEHSYTIDIGAGLFKSKGELGAFLDTRLQLLPDEIKSQVGFWTWLTVVLWPRLGLKKLNSGHEYYILDRSFRTSYRHLLWAPYQVHMRHRTDLAKARLILSSPVGHGELAEQLTSRHAIWSSPAALDLAAQIYVDKTTGSVKKIATSKKAGATRDYAHWIRRVAINYDIQSISTSDLQALLRPPLRGLID
jgi:hypothetical protein